MTSSWASSWVDPEKQKQKQKKPYKNKLYHCTFIIRTTHSWNELPNRRIVSLHGFSHKLNPSHTDLFTDLLLMHTIEIPIRIREGIIVVASVLEGKFEDVMTLHKVYSITWKNAAIINNSDMS